MEDLLNLANRLSSAGLAALLILILEGSRRGIWRWGRDYTELEARTRAEKQVLADDRDWWRGVGIRALGVAEVQGQYIRVKTREIDRIDTANTRLLGQDPR